MRCTPSLNDGELAFVTSLLTRGRRGRCRGPLLCLTFRPYRAVALEQIFDSAAASELLWSGHHDDCTSTVAFSLCAAHWLDLATLCAMRSELHRRADWAEQSIRLLREVCEAAGWDVKEIANMFSWQRERLT